MDIKDWFELIVGILTVLMVLVPYVATMMVRTKNKLLQGIGKQALAITSALEETELSGALKKEAATTKLNDLFGGNFVARLVGIKTTPEMLADQVDAAVATLRTMGIKSPSNAITSSVNEDEGDNT